jgi:hypothetical protein
VAGATNGGAAATSPQARRAGCLGLVWWGLGYWVVGQKGRALGYSLLELALVALIAAAVQFWPAFAFDFGRYAQDVKDKELKAQVESWHTMNYDRRLNGLLNGPVRWGTLVLAGLFFCFMEIRIPSRLRAAGGLPAPADGAGG